MERRSFLKGLFGAAGAAVVSPYVSGAVLEDKKDVMWIQVIAPLDAIHKSWCSGAAHNELYGVEWLGKFWCIPQDNGKIFEVDRSDILGTKVNKRYNSWNTGGPMQNNVSSPFIAMTNSGSGINFYENGNFNSATDMRGVVYQWWYEGGEEFGAMENQLLWTDGVDRSRWGWTPTCLFT